MAGLTVPTQRLFVAIPIPPEVRQAVDEWRATLDLPGRLVSADNLHITLRFIGDVDHVGKDRILAALDTTALPERFSIRIGAFGAFPNRRRATVGWASVADSNGQVQALAAAVDQGAESAGFGNEGRPFHAHLTLARIRPPGDVRAVESTLGVRVGVTEIVLYRSHFVGRGGVRYEVVESFAL